MSRKKRSRHSLSRRLQDLRDTKDWNKSKAATKLNIRKPTYNHYESGRSEPDIDRLFHIADFYGVSIDYLVGHNYIDKKDYKMPEMINNHREAIEFLSNLLFILKDASEDELIDISRLIYFIVKKSV